jgi:hypothetical protein
MTIVEKSDLSVQPKVKADSIPSRRDVNSADHPAEGALLLQ